MVRYLEGREKAASRRLWEEVFQEDSSSFLDYYDSAVAKGNQVLASVEDGQLVSMLHRNPYPVMAGGREWTSDYIVGVATRPEWRHKGHMRRLLTRALEDMRQEGMEFCFLMPAAKEIYLPFGFTYIFDQPQLALNEKGEKQLAAARCTEENGDYQEAAEFMEGFLASRYEVYAKRTKDYVRRLEQEVESDLGQLALLREDGQVKGILAYYGQETPVLRELLCLPEYTKEVARPKPAIMGRIVDLERFLKVARLKEESPLKEMTVVLQVEDGLIPENDGRFLWHLDQAGSWLERQGEALRAASLDAREGFGEASQELSLSISQMTGWLFGYPGAGRGLPGWCGHVRAFEGVYLDEVV